MGFSDLLESFGMLASSPLTLIFGKKVIDLPLPKFKKIKQDIKDFHGVCAQIILEKKAQSNPGHDLLGRLLKTQSSGDPELNFSDQDIIDTLATFYMTGMDTSANLIGMLFYCLSQQPEYLKDLEEERAATYNREENKTADMLQKMDALHAMCKETLRMYSPFPHVPFRVCLADHTLGDIKLKKGDLVEADLFATFFDEKYFVNPKVFNPNRWRDPNFKLDPYAFIPFSAGPKNCIGQHLAMMETKVIVSEILNRFDFKLRDYYKLKMALKGVYEPEEDMLFSLTPKA